MIIAVSLSDISGGYPTKMRKLAFSFLTRRVDRGTTQCVMGPIARSSARAEARFSARDRAENAAMTGAAAVAAAVTTATTNDGVSAMVLTPFASEARATGLVSRVLSVLVVLVLVVVVAILGDGGGPA